LACRDADFLRVPSQNGSVAEAPQRQSQGLVSREIVHALAEQISSAPSPVAVFPASWSWIAAAKKRSSEP
jgi:hypothetical protein